MQGQIESDLNEVGQKQAVAVKIKSFSMSLLLEHMWLTLY